MEVYDRQFKKILKEVYHYQYKKILPQNFLILMVAHLLQNFLNLTVVHLFHYNSLFYRLIISWLEQYIKLSPDSDRLYGFGPSVPSGPCQTAPITN